MIATSGALHLHLVRCTCPTTARAVRPPVSSTFVGACLSPGSPFSLDIIEHNYYNNTIPHLNNFTPFSFLPGYPIFNRFSPCPPYLRGDFFTSPLFVFDFFYETNTNTLIPPRRVQKPLAPMAVLKTVQTCLFVSRII